MKRKYLETKSDPLATSWKCRVSVTGGQTTMWRGFRAIASCTTTHLYLWYSCSVLFWSKWTVLTSLVRASDIRTPIKAWIPVIFPLLLNKVRFQFSNLKAKSPEWVLGLFWRQQANTSLVSLELLPGLWKPPTPPSLCHRIINHLSGNIS